MADYQGIFSSGGSGVQTIGAGTNIVVDNTNPSNPVVSVTGVALASHTHDAANITSGTIATARLGTGTANSATYLAGDQTYKAAVTSVNGSTGAVTVAAGDTTYALTIQDAENTNSQRNLVSFTVPANTIANGEIVRIDIYYESYNMSGVQYNFTTSTVIGGSILTSNVASIAGGTNGRYGIAHFFFIRQGSQLGTISSFSNDAYRAQEFANPTMFAGGSNVYDTRFFTYLSPNFTTSLTFAVTGQWSTANASAYVRVLNARAYKLAGQQT
jgi:hypothetical protein